MSAPALSEQRLNAAISYLLQLAVEQQTDTAAYANGAALLERLVAELEAHRQERLVLKRLALVAELVEPIMDRLRLEDLKLDESNIAAGPTRRSETCSTLSKWLRRKGIARTPDEVRRLLEQPVRNGARKRTKREVLLDQLASLVDASQSDFEKVVAVVERGKTKKGRLGNPLLHERAALDAPPTKIEMLLYALHALDVDEETGQQIVALLPDEQIELMYETIDEREHAAEVLAAGIRMTTDTDADADGSGGRNG